MINIRLDQASKRFQYEWIFKNINLQIYSKSKIAVTGSNGSGKSTFLKCVAGLIPLTDGNLQYSIENKEISVVDYFNHLTISAPYLELPEEFTLYELLQFHFKFKMKVSNLSFDDMLEVMYLTESKNKQIQYFSSGMKQRLKLGLCFFSDVPIMLLDEPTSNLDKRGSEWYQNMISDYGLNKTILVCSNDPKEYVFCDQIIQMEDFKQKSSI